MSLTKLQLEQIYQYVKERLIEDERDEKVVSDKLDEDNINSLADFYGNGD